LGCERGVVFGEVGMCRRERRERAYSIVVAEGELP
jgi:hypothetical protein